jgi:CRISPR/Cas system CSM-associated protein Csm3 (group 7 of RAMP superfamily)
MNWWCPDMPFSMFKIPIEIEIESPFLFGGLFARDYGLDTTQERDQQDRPIIPYSEVRGTFRHAVELLHEGEVDRLFGTEGGKVSERGCLTFGDFAWDGHPTKLRQTRVAIDEGTGAAKDGHLQFVEIVCPIGEIAKFAGDLHLLAADKKAAQETVDILNDAKGLIRTMGAFKTVGFGRVENISILELEKTKFCDVAPSNETDDFEFSFELDRPYLVDTHRIAANVLEGSSTIPGSALKGALATKLSLAGHDVSRGTVVGDLLSKVRIEHASPWVGNERLDPVVPLSAVCHHNSSEIVDAANPKDWKRALENSPVAFATDWKSTLKRLKSETITRTHNEIDRTELVAVEARLFSHVLRSQTWENKPVCFKSRVRFPLQSSSIEQDAFRLIRGALETGLFGIGKTRANTVDARVSSCERVIINPNPVIRIMLETPHLMMCCTDGQTAAEFANAIKSYWHNASKGSLKISERDGQPLIFCDEALAGGYAMSGRKAYGANHLAPFYLIAPGSVFCLEVVNETQAGTVLEEWLNSGLPTGHINGATIAWETCLYLPENGYGSIMLNPSMPEFEREST